MTQNLAAWRAIETLVDAGLVRQLGIGNCNRLEDLKGLNEAVRFKPAVVQNRFYADSNYDRDIRACCYCDASYHGPGVKYLHMCAMVQRHPQPNRRSSNE